MWRSHAATRLKLSLEFPRSTLAMRMALLELVAGKAGTGASKFAGTLGGCPSLIRARLSHFNLGSPHRKRNQFVFTNRQFSGCEIKYAYQF